MTETQRRPEAGARAPLYQQLAETLARQIETGEYSPGAALPPERRLAEIHGVSRITVRHALEQLARQGVVEQRRGSGTYVSAKVSQSLTRLTSLSDDVAARGMVAQSRLISRGVGLATPEEVIALGLSPGRKVTRIVRLRSADGQPLALEASTLVHEALPDPDEVGESLYVTLEARGMRPVRAVQRLSAISLDKHQAAMLETEPGACGLLITRIGYTAEDRAVEFTRSTFRGDRWDFVTELS
ncbi:GntR family transcriptional regulator [Chelativorans intermedius]|uniref:GntR family transcriptional regulator n=1 Tax=Chelativorans intermedius TaxID=515947 RepID=A0ABV6D2D3_9HYPH|nr:GntR family transcriptional regulator [Chelativorans intermedius]MCT8997386.1 GntR family transcriptional regulator [Chelativorans intermedius]